MKKNKFLTIIIIFFAISLIISSFYNTTYAAINEVYGEPTGVIDTNLDEKAKESSVLEYIASFVYWLASTVEELIGAGFNILTGTNEFPWADRIIFNTVAFLDVNFLNPEPGSLFLGSSGNDTALANVIVKVYGSIMTMAIGFLGVVVGIMSMKLAISTIASEKAKYKESIVKFVTSIVLLFCIHYGISIVFYVNEKLVEVASGILTDAITEANLTNALDLATNLSDEEKTELYGEANSNDIDNISVSDKEENYYAPYNGYVFNYLNYMSPFVPHYDNLYNKLLGCFTSGNAPFKDVSTAVDYINNNSDVASKLIDTFEGNRYRYAEKSLTSDAAEGFDEEYAILNLAYDIWLVKGGENESQRSIIQEYINTEMLKTLSIISDNSDEAIVDEFLSYYPTIVIGESNGKTVYDIRDKIDERKKSKFNLISACYLVNGLENASGLNKEFSTSKSIYSVVVSPYTVGHLFSKYNLNDINYSYLVQPNDGGTSTGEAFGSPDEIINASKSICYTANRELLLDLVKSWKSSFKYTYYDTIQRLNKNYEKTGTVKNISTEPIQIISSLGTYFKESVYGYETNDEGEVISWTNNNFTASGAIIYAIFIAQSIFYLFAYIKRFFYVTILALFAPVVILYNFLDVSLFKKNVLSVWLKEFCSLVLTQSVQAFVLAIIMTVVIYMASNGGTGQYAGSGVQPTALIAIVALASISKIELLVKQILGVDSKVGDPSMQNGTKTFLSGAAGTFAAIALGRKVLDNPKKIVGGILDTRKANRSIHKINSRRARDMANLEERKNGVKGEDKNTGTNPDTGLPESIYDTYRKKYAIEGENSGTDGTKNATNGLGVVSGVDIGKGSAITNSSVSATSLPNAVIDTANIQNVSQMSVIGENSGGNNNGGSTGNGDSGGKAKKMSQADWDNERNKLNDKYDDLLSKAKENRNNAKKMVASGLAETIGSIAGAGVGLSIKTVVDLAQGDANISSSVKGAMTGLGVGDWIGTKAVNTTSRVMEEVRSAKSDRQVKAETVRYVNKIKDIRANSLAENLPDKNSLQTGTSSPATGNNGPVTGSSPTPTGQQQVSQTGARQKVRTKDVADPRTSSPATGNNGPVTGSSPTPTGQQQVSQTGARQQVGTKDVTDPRTSSPVTENNGKIHRRNPDRTNTSDRKMADEFKPAKYYKGAAKDLDRIMGVIGSHKYNDATPEGYKSSIKELNTVATESKDYSRKDESNTIYKRILREFDTITRTKESIETQNKKTNDKIDAGNI